MKIKNILLACLALLFSAVGLEALNNDKVANYYKSLIKSNYGKDVEVKVVGSQTYRGFEVANVEIISGDDKTKHFMFVKDSFILMIFTI